jgi:hypothetical protein
MWRARRCMIAESRVLPRARAEAGALGRATGVDDTAAVGEPTLRSQVTTVASVDGFGFVQDRLGVIKGHLPPVTSSDEFVTTVLGAKALGIHVGQSVTWGPRDTRADADVIGAPPVGIAIGRVLWDAFARTIYVVPEPTVPDGAIALVGVGAIVFACFVAMVPGLRAARIRIAAVLRSG